MSMMDHSPGEPSNCNVCTFSHRTKMNAWYRSFDRVERVLFMDTCGVEKKLHACSWKRDLRWFMDTCGVEKKLHACSWKRDLRW